MSGYVHLGSAQNNLGHLWRDYWSDRWHFIADWPHLDGRKDAFLTASEGRGGEHPVVIDSPVGKSPFLGVVTLSDDLAPSAESGVVSFPTQGHLLTIAPTRTGKGTCQIVPNLLLYAASAVVIDVKGENYDITASHRAKMFPGARVVRFAPFSETEGDRYNPLDFVRVTAGGLPLPETFDDARLLADMLIVGKAGADAFWDIEARTLLHALILHVACRFQPGDPERNLSSVTAALFRASEKDDTGYLLTVMDIRETAAICKYAALEALAATLMQHEPKVLAGVFSTCRAEMKIWLSERLQKATAVSDFQFLDLKESMCRPIGENPAPTTLYIIVPPEYLHVYRSVARMMIGLATIELTRAVPWREKKHWRKSPPAPVLFFLDELPVLGKMGPIVEGLAYLAGYGVRLWSFAQNIGQLKEIYGESWHNFPANSAVTAFFGVNDPDTAEYVERLLGETPEKMVYYTHSVSSSTFNAGNSNGQGLSSSSGSSRSHRFMKEKVMSAAEVRALPEQLQLIFIRNRKPILASKLPFYRFELIKGLAGQWLLGA